MKMKLFNRQIPSNTTDTNASKSTAYYQNEPREHRAIAWLLAFVTFAVTLVLILALFFGGRWIYRKVSNKDSGNTQQASQPQGDTSKTTQNNGSNNNNQNSDNQPQNNSNDNINNSGTGTLPPQTSSTSTSQPSQAITSTPNTGPETQELVRTGPDVDL